MAVRLAVAVAVVATGGMATAYASTGGIAVRPSGALIPYDSSCSRDGVALLAGNGRLRRYPLPGRGSRATVASGPSGFSVAWATGGRAASASLTRGSGFDRPVIHGPVARYSRPEVIAHPSGERTVAWQDGEDVRLQRVGADGSADPVLTINSASLSRVVAAGTDGRAWLLYRSEMPAEGLFARLVSPDGTVSSAIGLYEKDPSSDVVSFGFNDAADDGRGGLFALISFDNDDSSTRDPSAGGPGTYTLRSMRLTADFRVEAQRVVRLRGGDRPDGRLAATTGRVDAIYHAYGPSGRGVFVRRVDVAAAPARRLRRDRYLAAAAGVERGPSPIILVERQGEGTGTLHLQRGADARRALRVADGGRPLRDGSTRLVHSSQLALEGRRRAYTAWERGYDIDVTDAAFARVVNGRRMTPTRPLWPCRQPR